MAEERAPDPEPAVPPTAADRPGRIAVRKAQLERFARSTMATIEARRDTSTPIGIAFDTYGHDNRSGGSVLAAALAFRIFLFYVPYVFFVVYVFGFGSDLAHHDPQDVARAAGMGGLFARAISAASAETATARIVIVVLSGYALFLGARGMIKVLRIVHGLVWEVPVPRPRGRSKGAVFIVLLLSAAVALSVAIHALSRHYLVGGIVVLVLYTLVPIGIWLYVSWLLPHQPVEIWDLLPGAIVFGVGIAVLHAFTVVYFPHLVSAKSDTYGVVGIALVVLFWAYLIGRLMTVAVVLNAALYFRTQRSQPGIPQPPPSWQSLLARTGGWFGMRHERRADHAAHEEAPGQIPDSS
jgi:uncharacterized BrkB/YihY/UPF0761 family membrane protein